MNSTAERLADFSLSEQRPLPDVAHFPYINDCHGILESNDTFTPEGKARFIRNLLILSNPKHKSWYQTNSGKICGQDYLGKSWNFSIENRPYRNGLSLEFYFEEAGRELVFGNDGINTMHNTPIEEGFWASTEQVEDVTAKQWLGKAFEVLLHNKQVDSRVRYGRAQYEQKWPTRFRK